MVDLGIAHQQSAGDRNADGAAEVAYQAEDAGRLGPQLRRQRDEGEGGQRHEHEADADALDKAGPIIVHSEISGVHDIMSYSA